MKNLKTYKQLFENKEIIYDGDFVANYVIDISDENKQGIPDFYIDEYIKPSNFKLTKLKISDLSKKDPDFNEYLQTNEDRYEGMEDDYYPDKNNLYNPVVVFNDVVLDGYNRMLMLNKQNINVVDAYVNVDNKEMNDNIKMKTLKTYKQLFEQLFDNIPLFSIEQIEDFINQYGINATEKINGESLLTHIIRNSNRYILNLEENVKFLLKKGIDINIVDRNNDNALNWSAYFNFSNICQLLIDAGININEQDVYGMSPLITAAAEKNYETVKVLIDNNCDINLINTNGRNALHMISKNISYNDTKARKILFILLDTDIDWFIKDNTKFIFLDYFKHNSSIINEIKKKYPKKWRKYMKNKTIKKFKI